MELIKVGKIIKPHGIKGDLLVKTSSSFAKERFQKNSILYLHDPEIKEMKIAFAKPYREGWIIRFEDFEDINFIEHWRMKYLYIKQDQLTPLAEDEVYYCDLMNCQVFDLHEKVIGIVEDIIETGSHIILRVINDQNKSILIPFVKAMIKEVNITKKSIIVDVWEGLI